MSEADIHFELYHHLENAIDRSPTRDSISYSTVHPEYSEGIHGRADIVVEDSQGDPIFVVEAKRPASDGSREIDPYSPAVIRQAFSYAGDLGAPFFCTYNRERLVVFDAFSEGVPLLERSTKAYTISDVEEFADTLLDEIARLKDGQTKWDAIDAAFIDRVNSLHDFIAPRLQRSLRDHLDSDPEFKSSFDAWISAQGLEYESADSEDQEKVRKEFAEQAAYLLINKLIFYKILENAPTYSSDIDPLAVSPYRVQNDLEDFFLHIVDEVDFEAIYEHDEIYSEIPLDPVAEKVREFIIELDERDLSQFDSDVIGQIYEGVIPAERRRELGEYYTPPAICDLITRLTIDDPSDRVLDPACGSGGFLVSAYHRFRELLPEPTGSHERILNQLSGVEINRFPAHLSAINLAIQDLTSYTREVDIEINDFFDIKRYKRFQRERATAGGGELEDGVTDQFGGFDCIVGNPPYIRQENINDKEKVRSHLGSQEVDGEYLSKRSDIYAYFLTHSFEFLNDGGDLGFITSDRWLDTKYGEDLQQFILENFEIRAIITFERQVFDDTLVDSSILLLRKQIDTEERENNVVKFIRLRDELDVNEIASLVEEDRDPDKMISTDGYRLVTRLQKSLAHQKKWNLFFIAPPIYFELAASPGVIELEDIADLSFGLKTGANKFFYAHPEEWDELGIIDYTRPVLKSIGQTGNKIRLSKENAAKWRVLDVHALVDEAIHDMDNSLNDDIADRVLDWLIDNGHEALAEYIQWGKDEEYHQRSSLSSRKVWFDLGELNSPPMFGMMFTWSEHRVIWNEAEAVADNQFYDIYPESELDRMLLSGLLNSRAVWLILELLSRRTGNPTMTRIQTKVYEYNQFPIPNPHQMTDSEKDRIINAFQNLMEKEKSLDKDADAEQKESERDQLDRAVLAPIGMEDQLDEIKEAVEKLVISRERAAGQHTEVLVERLRSASEAEPIELPGVATAREGTTLDSFQ